MKIQRRFKPGQIIGITLLSVACATTGFLYAAHAAKKSEARHAKHNKPARTTQAKAANKKKKSPTRNTASVPATTANLVAGISQAKVLAGDTVYSILRRHGFNDNQRNAALSKNLVPKDFILSPGDIYRVAKDAKSKRLELRFFAKKTPLLYTFWKQDEDSGSTVAPAKFEAKVQTVRGHVRGSLVESITAALSNESKSKLVDELVAYRFMDAFLLDYNLPKVLQKNAEFSITYEKLYSQGQFIRYGEVLRAEVEISGQKVVREFKPLKVGGIFLNPEDSYADRPFYAPVDYIRISSLFQPRRFHPIRKFRRAHEGIDFELPEGEPVYSVTSGFVDRVGKNRAAGNYIVIRHSNGYESFYNHLHKVGSFNVGQRIGAGQKVGEVGCTGYCTNPHLHFAVKKSGRYINPISLVRGYSYGQRSDVHELLAVRPE